MLHSSGSSPFCKQPVTVSVLLLGPLVPEFLFCEIATVASDTIAATTTIKKSDLCFLIDIVGSSNEISPPAHPTLASVQGNISVTYYCFEFVLSNAARNPRASFTASSSAQKCIKNRRG